MASPLPPTAARRAALLLAAAGVATACAARSPAAAQRPESPPATAPPAVRGAGSGEEAAERGAGPLAVSIEQYREDEAAAILQIKVRNVGAETQRVKSVRLVWPGLAAAAPATLDYLVAAGVKVDVPVGYGAALCPPGADAGPPQAAVEVAPASNDPAAATTTLFVTVDGGLDVLERIRRHDCERRALADAIDIAFDPTWTPTTVGGRPALRGALVLRRRGATGAVTMKSVQGSVLLAIAPQPVGKVVADRVLVLPTGQSQATVAVLVSQSGRCEAHALAESKKTFEFDIDLDLASGGGVVTVVAEGDTRKLMQRVIDETCGG